MSLAPYLNASALPVDVLVREAHDLDNAQPLDPHEVDDEEVAEAAHGVLVRRKPFADLLDLVDGEIFIVLIEMLRVAQLQVGAWVLGDEGEPLRDLVERADRRALDHEGRRAVTARAHILHVDADLVVVYVTERVEILLHAPVEEKADGKLVGVARVRCRCAARDVAREIFVEMRDEILGRDGVLPHVQGELAHAAHTCGRSLRASRRDAHRRRPAAPISFVCRHDLTRFRFRSWIDYSTEGGR